MKTIKAAQLREILTATIGLPPETLTEQELGDVCAAINRLFDDSLDWLAGQTPKL